MPHALAFLGIFAVVLCLYGALIMGTRNKELIPRRAVHSIRDEADVYRVGKYVVIVGFVLGAVLIVTACLLTLVGYE
jgi:hypothetical protein